ILYTTVLSGAQGATGLAIDPAGNVIFAGYVYLPNLPVSIVNGVLAQNVVIAKLDASSGNIIFSKQFGGTGTDSPSAIQTDSSGNIYVSRRTTSMDSPTTPGTMQPVPLIPAWG